MNSIEQGGKFTTPAARNKAVKEGLRALFDERVGANQSCAPELEGNLGSLLNSVAGSLRHEPPEASQAAEAALSIAQFSLSEGRVLNVIDLDAGDLNENGRLDGDRSVGDFLCREILQPRQIPATKGPLQSSSFRGGYLSRQVRNSALKKYVEWQSRDATTLDEVRAFAVGIVDVMLAQASKMPAWVDISASKLTFASYLQVRERLLAEGSGGAFEQYLLAGFK
ncbi:hypothetical protein K3888_14775 [Dietzia aurantiaca]|uniref:hypothetical protein n=1 Tax=Dietzia aurantiaca TaxID=983873 RepID=UPI001E3B577B|nr:hypothetical protein [Dietzia aurantiaca]MCD2263962.1 hypothetical protein [Dietzia aurantiaca]